MKTGRTLRVFNNLLTDEDEEEGNVDFLDISSKGDFALCGTRDHGGWFYLIDLVSGEIVRSMKSPAANTRAKSYKDSIAFSTDNKCAVSSLYGQGALWDLETGNCLHLFEVEFADPHFSPDGLSVSSNGVFLPDGKSLLSCNEIPGVLLEVSTGKCIKRFLEYRDLNESNEASSDSESIFAPRRSKATLRLWDISNGSCLRLFNKFVTPQNVMCFTPDGHFAVTGGFGAELNIWNVYTGECVQKMVGHTNDVNAVAFSPDGRYVLSAGGDCAIRLWETDWDFVYSSESDPVFNQSPKPLPRKSLSESVVDTHFNHDEALTPSPVLNTQLELVQNPSKADNLAIKNDQFVFVQGEASEFVTAEVSKSIASFYINKYQVTWLEWLTVRAWASSNGYDIEQVGAGIKDDHPVQCVSWYDALKWCNAKSEMERLCPCYSNCGSTYKTGDTVPETDNESNGYRLPTEAEWEWAARGGIYSHGYKYSGGYTIGAVAWYNGNSFGPVNIALGQGPWPVGRKTPNELGLFDMSGNVWEWCWDLLDGSNRILRGGSWDFVAAHCAVSRRFSRPAKSRFNNIGFRITRNQL
jgi:formylglycine-generating enzyme required for sulfatase activity